MIAYFFIIRYLNHFIILLLGLVYFVLFFSYYKNKIEQLELTFKQRLLLDFGQIIIDLDEFFKKPDEKKLKQLISCLDKATLEIETIYIYKYGFEFENELSKFQQHFSKFFKEHIIKKIDIDMDENTYYHLDSLLQNIYSQIKKEDFKKLNLDMDKDIDKNRKIEPKSIISQIRNSLFSKIIILFTIILLIDVSLWFIFTKLFAEEFSHLIGIGLGIAFVSGMKPAIDGTNLILAKLKR